MSGRPSWKSAEIGLFRPFSPFSGGCEEHLGNPENGGKRPFSSDILRFALKPPSLKPPFAALQITITFDHFEEFGCCNCNCYHCILNYYPVNSKTILWGNSEITPQGN